MMQGFINNERDRRNLEFLMLSDPKTLEDWALATGHDDLEYAWELLAAYALELNEEARELELELELTAMQDNYQDAQQLIAQFKGA